MLYRYLLFMRFALANIVATTLLAAAYFQGWLDGLLAAHLVEMSVFIFLVFLYGLALCGARVWQHGVELNGINAGTPGAQSGVGRYLANAKLSDSESRSLQIDALRLKLTDRIVGVRHIANSLIFLGLIGTVVGFIIALSGVDPEAATQVENVSAMVSTLVNGMSVAMNTTLVGAVLYVWLNISYRILVTGTVELIATAIDVGEAGARA